MNTVLYLIYAIVWFIILIAVDVWAIETQGWDGPTYIWGMCIIFLIAIWVPVLLWD